MTFAPAHVVRREFGRGILGDASAVLRLGRVRLEPHQRDAVARIGRAMAEFGGALLADETGLGKTYVALAVGRSATRPLVVAPAALRSMWRTAMAEADCRTAFVSMESLGTRRRVRPTGEHEMQPGAGRSAHDLVIVDEAHHARNPATARYRALARLCAGARILLLSATPVHNSRRDLDALLALFLGARASSVDDIVTARCIIRRGQRDAGHVSMPAVLPKVGLPIDHDERTLDAIVALPPAVPPADGEDPAALLAYSLVRQWASSHGALRGALRRRLARASALLDALESGRYPTRRELGAWSYADLAVQLALPGLVVAAAAEGPLTDSARDALTARVRSHASAVRALLDDLRVAPDVDGQRAARLTELRTRHPGERIVAFAQFAETIDALFDRLRRSPGVCALTADGAQVAGGALTRGEALARFAPAAHGVIPPRAAEAIDLLLATDLLSEGVNLQDASVVVHLDVPWTPARMEQRVGRLARLGSPHPCVHVYSLEPPASATTLLRIEDRLRAKLAASARAIGIVGSIVPSLFPMRPECPAADRLADRTGSSSAVEALRALAGQWAAGSAVVAARAERVAGPGTPAPGTSPTDDHSPVIAAVRADASGWIALLSADDGDRSSPSPGPRVIAALGGHVGEAPDAVLRAMALASGAEIDAPPHALAVALEEVERWRSTHRVRAGLAIDVAVGAPARRRVIERIAAITRRAPAHLRPSIASLAAIARRSLGVRFGAGAEAVLAELAQAPLPDEAWLRAVNAFGALHDGRDEHAGRERLRALLLLVARDADPEGGA
jgi:superfamily II DNA or RNA helicase